jgi:SAM-dependent methyltransferase
MLYHLDDPTVALREFSRVLRPGGRLAAALNGRDHLAELRAIGPAIGRPELLRGLVVNDLVAENAADMFSRFFDDVAVERYPSELEVPAVEPILDYLATLAGEPLAPAEQGAVRELVQATIDAEGNFRIRGHSVLVTATR